ncbi:IPT/TIG domain-containing protein [Ruminococcaceae bacterium OttesenSCG-928-A11]|nr:IPT/TIG domain-containing protein [Ruminococcaceae bacterium OttesenSCG-928-A11]
MAVVAVIVGLSVILYNVLAAGPFTVTPNRGDYAGGNEITITGSNFATQVEGWTDKSYVAKSDLVIQLDGIQNRRDDPLPVGTTMDGNIATATGGATDNGYFWQDLACSEYQSGTAEASGIANCQDFIPKYSTGNQPTVVNIGNGAKAIHLNGNNGFQVSRAFNLASTVNNATNGTYNTAHMEVFHRSNSVKSGTATKAVLYEYGTADTTNPGLRLFRYASAVNTGSWTSCFANHGRGRNNAAYACANNTSWQSESNQHTRARSSANGNTTQNYHNGAVTTVGAASTTTFTPESNTTWFIGARSITTTDGTSNTGSYHYDGEIAAFRTYRRRLTAQEVLCNYYVDQARYDGYIISAAQEAACATGASNITGTGIAKEITMSESPIVTVGGEVCEITSYSESEIKCIVPAGSAGRADVVVTPAASTGLPSQSYFGGYEYVDSSFEYEIMNTGVNPFTYKINPDTLRVDVAYDHASLITITYPRTASDGSTTVMTNSVTMANSSTRTTIGGQCGGVACATTTVKITGDAANINGANGLIAYLNSLEWSGNAGFLRGDIRITILPEDVEFWIDADGNRHFYELVDSGNSALTWSQAYNLASQRTFKGLKGYLMSMTEKAEADIILQYAQNTGNSGVGYTAGIRFRQNVTGYPKVDATIGYEGNPITEMPAMPTGQTSMASYGYACTGAGITNQGCPTSVAAITSTAPDACPSAAAYDTQWYWANPVDNGKEYYSGRVYTECTGNPLKTTDLTDYWNGAQPQGGESIMAYSSASGSFGWHDYSNNVGTYYYVEYSEGWFDSGTYDIGETTYWTASIPLEITIHHVRANTGETLAPDTKAPSMGLNTTTNQFQCSQANGGKTISGYYWSGSSCTNGQFPYDPTSTTQEITYIYTHNSVPNPVPFRMERSEAGGNYVYKMYSGDVGTAVNDFGAIRQVIITYPTELVFSSVLPNGWSANITSGKTAITVPQEFGVTASQVQNYLYTISLTASGMNNITGTVAVEVADYQNASSTDDPGRTSSSGVLPQPINYHYYRLGYTNDLLPISETIGLVGQSFNLSTPPQYLTNCAVACTSTGANAANADYEFYQAIPAIGSTITYRGTPSDVYYYYQPANGLTVSFSMNGNTAIENIPDQFVVSGDNAVRPPTDPIVLGKRFAGWYDTNICTTEFDFANTQILNNITIYACFTIEANMTVVFDDSSLSGTPEVSTNPSQITDITYNDLINAPTSPILPGHAFSSWNTEPMIDSTTCSGTPWDFAVDRVNAPVGERQITLYVCWEPRGNVTVNFNTSTNAPATVQILQNPTSRSVRYNSTTVPPTSPISEGYAFINWNTEPMVDATTCGGTTFNFNSTRFTSAATAVYACWEKKTDLSITFLKGEKDGDPNIQGWPVNVHDMPYNSAAAAYQPEVTLDGWRLSHWCESTNPNCSRNDRFDWTVRRTSSVTLVAMWREDIMAIDEIVPNFGSTAGGYRVTIYGSGFLAYDANSYAQNGLMVLLDGENNAGTLSSPSHNASSSTWNNLAPAASTAFGNFALSGTTINSNSVLFNGSSSRAKSGGTATLNGSVGGTAISTVTTEVAYKQNTAGSTYSQLYEYGPFNSTNGSFGEVLNASAYGTFSNGNCYIGQRTGGNTFTGGYGTCANNTISTTHTSIHSKASGTPRRLILDGNASSPVVNASNTATSFANNQSVVIGARSTTTAQDTFANHANISVNSFRMYNRTLTDTEIRCNYLVDVARFQGVYDIGLSSCGSQLQPIMPDRIEINGEACTNVIINNESQLTCVVPASTLEGNDTTAPYREGVVDAYIKIGDKESTLTDGFTYQAPLTVFNISPPAGPDTGGNTITITGTDFRDMAELPAGVPEVKIGNNTCTNVILSGDYHSLTCVVPASTTGSGQVDVTLTIPNRNQTATVTNGYAYYSSLSITNVIPNVGGVDGGTEIVITGNGFGDVHMNYGVTLDYGGSDPAVCIITAKTANSITCTTTARDTSGVVDVTVSNGVVTVSSVAAFTYVEVAESYTNLCYDEENEEWVNGDQNYIFIEQGSSASCKITLDAPYEGTFTLSDDYYDTIDPTLSGSFSSNDSRFSNGVFTLSYSDSDVSTPTTGQVLYYTYTAPAASTLEQYYDGTDTSEGYVGNGYDLYWPALEISNSQNLESGDSKIVVFGLYAEKYWIYPSGTNNVYVVGSNGVFTLSTHGAYHPGTISLSEDLTYSDNPNGTTGIFSADSITPNNVVDMSELEGADSGFSYQPQTSATGLNYIRINGSSSPAITNTHYDIKVADSCLTVTGPANMTRGQTAEFTLTASCGGSWSGSVELSDPFSLSGEVGGVFADTSTGNNPTGTFNAGTKTYTFTAGAGESYVRTFNWTMRDDSITPPAFPSYIIYITVDDGIGASYTPVFVQANSIRFACASGYSNCTTGYVGSLFDIAISPNGMMVGRAHITTDGGGQLGNNGMATWSTSDPYVMSATPRTPGLKTLTATVTESNNSNMVDQVFLSTDTSSFDDYIWVMANATALSGEDEGVYGKPSNFTLTMNGPFVGTIELSDVISGTSTSAGGTFSVSQCTFTKANYDVNTNTTSCNFTYTPAAYSTNTTVILRADKQSTYLQAVASSTLELYVYAPASVSEVCRTGTGGSTLIPCDNSGSFAGGENIVIRGTNFIPYNNLTPDVTVTFDIGGTPAICTSVVVVDNNTITCTTPAHVAGTVDVTVDNEEEIATSVAGFMYRPQISSVMPSSGFTTGGDTITVSGGGFVSGNTTVTIGGNNCTNINIIDPATLTCTTPVSSLSGNGTGLVDAVVTVNNAPSPTLANAFSYELPLAITSISPNIGIPSGGNTVTVTGVGFSIYSIIFIGEQQCTNINLISSTQLTCTVPSSNLSGNGEGVVSAMVVDGDNPTHVLENAYTYRELMYASVAAPNPVPTAGGTTFSIVGYNFIPPSSYTGGASTTVTFISNSDSSRLSCTNVNVVSNMLITCITPQANVGTYSVEINNGYETGILTGVLTYEPNPMIATGITPSLGLTSGGNTVTITGSGFGENHITNPAYTQLEYLNFTAGTTGQYINTGVNPTTNTKVEADFQYNTVATSTASYLFGTRTGNYSGHFSFFKTTSNNFYDSWNTTSGTSVRTFNTSRNYIVKDNGNTFINDTSVVTRTGNSPATTRPIYIGQINAAGSVLSNSYYNGKLWSFKIYTNNNLVRDYVPACRNSDGVGGLYDLVNNTFYASASSTAFSCTGIPIIETEVEINGEVCANATINSDSEITCTVPASTLPSDGSGTADVYVAIGNQNNTLVGAYTYYNAATGYTNECREGPNEPWTTQPYIPQGGEIECRIILNNPYQGTIDLTEDYEETIGSGLGGYFESDDPRFTSFRQFTLTYTNTLNEEDRILYYTYEAPDSNTLDAFYEEYTDPEDCDERCDNGFDLYWPLLSVSSSGDLGRISNELVVGLFAEAYYIYPSNTYTDYCVDCTVGFTVSTRGAPYFGTIELYDDIGDSDNPSGTSGVFSLSEINMEEFDGSDASFNYTPKTPATNGNFLRVYGISSDPDITDSYYDLLPVYQSTMTINGPTALERGDTGTYTLTIVDAVSWAGTVALTDVFSVGGAAGGQFVDLTNDGSFNSLTNTYTFSSGGSYTRTFTYTMRDDRISGTTFPGYAIRLVGDNGTSTGYTIVSVLADDLTIRCGANYPNCTTAYVGETKDISLNPNGVLIGNGQITDNSGGQFTRGGAASWSGSESFVTSYSPTTPGHKTITTTISSVTNTSMDDQTYNSTSASSLNSYVYVYANRMTISGPTLLLGGSTATYTMTLNGPFVGTINLSDIYSNGSLPANGVFSSTFCTFSLQNYVYTNNNESLGTGATTCTFQYTPNTVTSNQNVRINGAVDGSYPHEMILIPANITVRTPMTVSDISPDSGSNAGGETVTITGENLNAATGITIGGETCYGFTVISTTEIECVIPEYDGIGLVDIVITGSDNEVLTLEDSFEYYAPLELTDISPTVGPARGGTIITITGSGFMGGGIDGSNASVWLGDAECVIEDYETDVTDTTIVCTSSESDIGAVDVIVNNGSDETTMVGGYEYVNSLEIDTVCQSGTGPTEDDDPECQPYGSINGNEDVIITGENFIAPGDVDGSETTVVFDYDETGAVECSITEITNNTIYCTTGAHSAGLVNVWVDNGFDSSLMDAVPGDTIADLPTSGYMYIDTYINLVSDEVKYEVSPSAPENSNYVIKQIGTNNPTGYTLSLQADGSDLVCLTDDTKRIPSITTDGELTNSPTSTWGYNTVAPIGPWTAGVPDTPTTWKRIPAESPDAILTTSEPALIGDEDKLGLFFGTKIMAIQDICVYKQVITVTAVGNVW